MSYPPLFKASSSRITKSQIARQCRGDGRETRNLVCREGKLSLKAMSHTPGGVALMVLTPFQQQLLVIGFWLVMLPIAAFILRNACGLLQATIPSWKRAIFMVLFV